MMNADYKKINDNTDTSKSAQSVNQRKSVIQTMKKYPKYKPSGVEWIGEIPEHWDLKRLKYEAITQSGYAFKSDEFVEDGTPIIRIGDVAPKIDLDGCKKTSEKNIPAEFKLRKNDTLIALSGATVGKMCFVDEDMNAYINQRVARVTNGTKWLHHILNSEFFIEQIELTAGGSAQENISTNDFAKFFIPIPFKPEQTAIANFLDEKTTQLDKLITHKQKLIELLKEERTVIVNKAVTRGINPNVKLKPSGIEWLGDIPEHWEVKKIKNICKIQGRIGFKGYRTADLVPKGEGAITLGASHITRDHKLDLSEPVFLNWDKYYESPEIMVKQGDVVFTQRGVYLGKVAYIDKDYGKVTINPSLILLKEIMINGNFLKYFLTSSYICSNIDLISSNTAIPMISQEQLSYFYCLCPPTDEQIQIVQYIDNETKRIDDTISKIEKEIELLQEYRTALISEVVTGKIKVA